MCAGQCVLGRFEGGSSYSCVWDREDVDTASMGWQGVAQWSHLHLESTDPTMPAAPRSHRKWWLSCPLQEAAVLSGQALDNVTSQQVLQDEVVRKHQMSIRSHHLNPFKHHPKCRHTCGTGEHTENAGYSPGKWSTVHRVDCRAPLTSNFCACMCNFFILTLSTWLFVCAQDLMYKLICV